MRGKERGREKEREREGGKERARGGERDRERHSLFCHLDNDVVWAVFEGHQRVAIVMVIHDELAPPHNGGHHHHQEGGDGGRSLQGGREGKGRH